VCGDRVGKPGRKLYTRIRVRLFTLERGPLCTEIGQKEWGALEDRDSVRDQASSGIYVQKGEARTCVRVCILGREKVLVLQFKQPWRQ